MEPIRVTSRSFRGRQSLAIAGMTFAGLAVVWIAATAGLHPVVTTALLIAVMLWLALRAGGEVVYTLDERGVRREFRSLLAARAGLAASATELGWDEIASFRHQRDMSRSFQEVESIELQGPTGPPWIVTDRQDPAGFARFRDAFLLRVGTRTAAVRAPDFYATWRARADRVLLDRDHWADLGGRDRAARSLSRRRRRSVRRSWDALYERAVHVPTRRGERLRTPSRASRRAARPFPRAWSRKARSTTSRSR